jgi:hypothetical protein
LEIYDAKNQLVRRFASDDKPEEFPAQDHQIPAYWVRPPRILPNAAGMQRFVWDLRYPDPPGARRTYPISAIYRDTPSEPHGPAVAPGSYAVKLTVNGKTYTQTLNVRMDPRVVTPAAGLARQSALSMQVYEGIRKSHEALTTIRRWKEQIKKTYATGDTAAALTAFEKTLSELDGSGNRPAPGATPPPGFTSVNSVCLSLLGILQEADMTPTAQAEAAANKTQADLALLSARWEALRKSDLPALNQKLQAAGLPQLSDTL